MQPLSDVRHHEGADGARTSGGQANAERVVKLLNDALAPKILRILRYKRHYFMTAEISSCRVKEGFLQCISDERAHAEQLVKRIVELGSKLEFTPGYPARGEFANDTGRSNLTYSQSIEEAAKSGDTTMGLSQIAPRNIRIPEAQGVDSLSKGAGEQPARDGMRRPQK